MAKSQDRMKRESGTAFPVDESSFRGQEYGLTKREIFAMHIMASMYSNMTITDTNSDAEMARDAVIRADKLLHELATK